MLYREIMAVCSEIHTKHINTLCGQNVELLNVKLAVHIVTTGLQRSTMLPNSSTQLYMHVPCTTVTPLSSHKSADKENSNKLQTNFTLFNECEDKWKELDRRWRLCFALLSGRWSVHYSCISQWNMWPSLRMSEGYHAEVIRNIDRTEAIRTVPVRTVFWHRTSCALCR